MTVARERPQAPGSRLPWIAAGIGVLVIIGGVWAYVASRPRSASVARRDIVATVTLNGEVIAPPGERADVFSPFRAPVAKVYTTVGANVRRGDVLVELSLPSAQVAYEEAQRNLRAAEAAYAAAARTYGAEVRAAERRLAEARAREQRARQGISVRVGPADESAPSVSVTAPGTNSADLDAATQERLAAEEALLQARARRDAALIPYRQQLEVAREQFREAQSGRKQALVRSPIAGTVLALDAQPGQTVGEDRRRPLATIVDLDALEVHAELRPEDVSLVRPGMRGTLTVEEVRNETFEARVHSVTTEPGRLGGQRYVAILHVINRNGLVKPGMKARAAVEVGRAENALAVPNDAIGRDSTGRPYVRVLRGGRWVSVVVEPGLSDGRFTEVRSGDLKEGDIVQVRPTPLS